MKHLFAFILSLIAFSAIAADSTSNAQSALESRLSTVELRTAKFISGKEKMTKGFADLAPSLRLMACRSYPVASAKDTIKDLKKEIAFLEKKKNFAQLNSEQVSRLARQKDVVAKLTPSVDCSAFE